MTTKEILIAARARIEKPENWTQYHMAKDAKGSPVGARDYDAVCWCMAGAIRAASPPEYQEAFKAVEMAIAGRIDGRIIPAFNDHQDRTHTEVLAAFDKAIAALP